MTSRVEKRFKFYFDLVFLKYLGALTGLDVELLLKQPGVIKTNVVQK